MLLLHVRPVLMGRINAIIAGVDPGCISTEFFGSCATWVQVSGWNIMALLGSLAYVLGYIAIPFKWISPLVLTSSATYGNAKP